MEEKKPKILVVDDEPEIVNVLKEFLSLKGFLTTGVLSAEEALSLLETEKYDCILLDIMMPGMKGTEAAKIIKNKYPEIKVIILTGFINYADTLKREKLLEAVFKKPFSLQELTDKISNIISLRKKEGKDLGERSKIQGRVLIIKAKLLFVEPDSAIFNSLNEYFKQLRVQGKEYDLSVALNKEEAQEKARSFNPDLIMVNSSLFKQEESKILATPKEIIIYNISEIRNLQNPELEKLAKSVESSCLKNGLIEVRWVEI